jgi:hypothetical protein
MKIKFLKNNKIKCFSDLPTLIFFLPLKQETGLFFFWPNWGGSWDETNTQNLCVAADIGQ